MDDFYLNIVYKDKHVKFRIANPMSPLSTLMNNLRHAVGQDGRLIFDFPSVDSTGAPLDYFFGKEDPEVHEIRVMRPRIGRTEQTLGDYNVKNGDTVCISGYEHNSVTRTLKGVGARIVVAKSRLFDTQDAIDAFDRLIPHVDAVVCNHVSNVFGFVLPVYEISKMCEKHGVPFILDASQSAGIIDIDMQKLNAAFVAMPGHKGLLGPQGTGILICNADPRPFLYGGTGADSVMQDMPDYLPDACEAGTHNVVGIAGLAEGIKYVARLTPSHIGTYEAWLCSQMAESLRGVDGLEVFSTDNGTQAGVLSVRHKSINVETLCEKLGAKQIAARCGLHCAPFAHQTVGTINTGTLRFSFSPFITKNQVKQASSVLKNIIIYEKLINR